MRLILSCAWKAGVSRRKAPAPAEWFNPESARRALVLERRIREASGCAVVWKLAGLLGRGTARQKDRPEDMRTHRREGRQEDRWEDRLPDIRLVCRTGARGAHADGTEQGQGAEEESRADPPARNGHQGAATLTQPGRAPPSRTARITSSDRRPGSRQAASREANGMPRARRASSVSGVVLSLGQGLNLGRGSILARAQLCAGCWSR